MVRLIARLLAPLALATVAVGVYLIVHSTIDNKTTTTATQSDTTLRASGRHQHKAKGKAKRAFYVVKQGDTLSSIAAKTGVSLTQLTNLNPSVSAPPYSLQTGQRLRLRRLRR